MHVDGPDSARPPLPGFLPAGACGDATFGLAGNGGRYGKTSSSSIRPAPGKHLQERSGYFYYEPFDAMPVTADQVIAAARREAV